MTRSRKTEPNAATPFDPRGTCGSPGISSSRHPPIESQHSTTSAWQPIGKGQLNTTRICRNPTHDIAGLDVVLKLGDLVLELLETNLIILNDDVDLELLDTVSDGDKLGATPDQTVLLD